MKQCPQEIRADQIASKHAPWPQMHMEGDDYWHPARPLSRGGLWTRLKLAWRVFKGECDALQWYQQ